MVLYTYVAVGAKIFFIDNPQNLLKYIKEIKPHYISSVPRVLEKVHNEINFRVKKSPLLKRKIVKMALKAGERETKQLWNRIINSGQLMLADLLVYRSWRKVMGGKLKGIIVGAAAMQPHISRLFDRVGIPVKEGYGLTETSPVISFNRFEVGGSRYGSVGIPLPGVEVKILNSNENGEGEIIVRGPNVMMGYYNNESLTKEKINPDGWFHTGDIGKFEQHFLYITDRKKNIFKTSSGKYIYPQKIENLLKQHDAIDQCMVVGFQRPYISVLILPDFQFLKSWCKKNSIHWTAELYMVENDRVKIFYDDIFEKMNLSLKNHEKIKSHTLLAHEWTVETEEYTPTLKLRRAKILEKYDKKIDLMYSKHK
jgi:long-chain acyl-CoA synthetase